MINHFLEVISGIGSILSGDISLSDLFSILFQVLFTFIQGEVLDFLSRSKDFFSSLGIGFYSTITRDGAVTFTDNFIFWILGVFIGIWLLKYIITALINFIQYLLDIT